VIVSELAPDTIRVSGGIRMNRWIVVAVLALTAAARAEEKLPSVLEGFKRIQKVLVDKDAAALRASFDARTAELVESGRLFRKIQRALEKQDAEFDAWLKDEGLELDAAAARALDPKELSWLVFTTKTFRHLEAWGPASIRLEEVSSKTARVTVKAPDPELGGAISQVALALEGGGWRLTTASIRSMTGIRSVRNPMKQMGVYMALYESKFRRYPTCWDEMVRPDMCQDTDLFLSSDMDSDEKLVYVFPLLGDACAADAICAYDPAGAREGVTEVLFFQGRVESMTTADLEAKLAAQLDGWKEDMDEQEKKALRAVEGADGAKTRRANAEVTAIRALRDLRESLRKK
jgi:hypothetical protein